MVWCRGVVPWGLPGCPRRTGPSGCSRSTQRRCRGADSIGYYNNYSVPSVVNPQLGNVCLGFMAALEGEIILAIGVVAPSNRLKLRTSSLCLAALRAPLLSFPLTRRAELWQCSTGSFLLFSSVREKQGVMNQNPVILLHLTCHRYWASEVSLQNRLRPLPHTAAAQWGIHQKQPNVIKCPV